MLFLYRRVFNLASKGFRITLWMTIVFTSLWAVAFVFADLFACGVPVTNTWTSENKCINQAGKNTANNVLDVAMDLVLLALPVAPVSPRKPGSKATKAGGQQSWQTEMLGQCCCGFL